MKTVEQELLHCSIHELKLLAWHTTDEDFKKLIKKMIKIKKEMRYRDFIKDEV